MTNVNKLPLIDLESVETDVIKALDNNQVRFLTITEAPWLVRKLAYFWNENYIAYKNVIYVPEGHVIFAQSKEPNDRIIATSKILPWFYAVKYGSVSSLGKLVQLITNPQVRCYYFLFEYAMLKSHELPETPELVAVGFMSTRRNILGFKKNPENLVKVLKLLIRNKVKTAN